MHCLYRWHTSCLTVTTSFPTTTKPPLILLIKQLINKTVLSLVTVSGVKQSPIHTNE